MKKGGRTLPSFYPFAGSANGRFDHCMSGDAKMSSGQSTHENLGQPHSSTSLLLSRRAYHVLCVGGSCVHVRSRERVFHAAMAASSVSPYGPCIKQVQHFTISAPDGEVSVITNLLPHFGFGQGKITSGMFPPPQNGVRSTSARPMREIADCQRDN